MPTVLYTDMSKIINIQDKDDVAVCSVIPPFLFFLISFAIKLYFSSSQTSDYVLKHTGLNSEK